MISFSTMTKNELSKLEVKADGYSRAELAAIIQISGAISINGQRQVCLEIGNENASIARRIFNLIKLVYGFQSEIVVRKNKQLKKTNKYVIKISDGDEVKRILKDIGVLHDDNVIFGLENRISEEFKSDRNLKRAYIRGAFLGAGSISNPEKMYHFEFITSDEDYGKDLLEMVNSFGLNSKVITRKESYIIYLKEGEQVVDLLNIIGAHSSLLKLEDIRVMKEMRNNINRIVNCETANLAKTINASLRQINKIEYIKESTGLEFLPANLRETAELRLKHRDASLKELGKLHSPAVGKSGVNHRLRKLEEAADEIKERRGEKNDKKID